MDRVENYWQTVRFYCGTTYTATFTIAASQHTPIVSSTQGANTILITKASSVGSSHGSTGVARADSLGSKQWYTTVGLTSNQTPAHEFGHSLGLDDRIDGSTTDMMSRRDLIPAGSQRTVQRGHLKVLYEKC